MKQIGRAVLAGACAASAVAAGSQAVGWLNRLAPGQWEIHEIGKPESVRRLCLSDPRQFVHLDQPAQACRRTVLSEEGNAANFRFVCPRVGNGVTRLTAESPSIVRVQVQGLLRGAPFDRDYEARRIGRCR